MRWPEPNCPQDPPLLRKWSPLLTWQPIRKGSASLSAARQNLRDAAQLSPQVQQDLTDPRPQTKNASCSWTSETWAAHSCILFSVCCINKQTTLKLWLKTVVYLGEHLSEGFTWAEMGGCGAERLYRGSPSS